MKMIDLHVHTTASDGTFTPKQLVDYALKQNLSAVAMTDHDTMRGVEEAMDYINENALPLELIPGMEMSASGMGRVYGLHILAYFLDKSKAELKDIIEGAASDFTRSLGTPNEALRIIAEYGGISSLAHPLEYSLSLREFDKLLGQLSLMGLNGVEAIYTTHSKSQVEEFSFLANKHKLLITGGSDFHGYWKPGVDLGTGFGKMKIPYAIVEAMKEKSLVAH